MRNGLAAAAGYDLDYRLTSLALKNGATDVISLSYAYGDGMNLTAINDNVAPSNTVALAYTAANRLSTAAGPWGSTTWTYDGVGNRLTEVTGAVSTVTTIAANSNRMSQVAVNGSTTRSFTHDAAGNLTVDQRGSFGAQIDPLDRFAGAMPRRASPYTTSYNVRNRPSSVTRTGTSSYSATYAYNGLEQMVSRSTTAPGAPSGTVHYLYDLDGHLIAEADGATGATLREYIWLASNDNLQPSGSTRGEPVDLPLALVTGVNTASPVLSMVHADHLGRPIRLTDASRATVWQASYTPFGEPQSISGTIEQNLRFPGQYFLIETNLAYNWHRAYDPTTGRYTQPDPLRFVDGPSVYAYVGGSPFGFVDRQGYYVDANGNGVPDDDPSDDVGFDFYPPEHPYITAGMMASIVVVPLVGAEAESLLAICRAAIPRPWWSARSGGGGIRWGKGGPGFDWHRFKLNGKMTNRPHYHRGPTKSQRAKHRPWQGW